MGNYFLALGVEETSLTEGTGTLSLAGATAGHRTFVTGFGTGSNCYYTLLWGAHWECGLGTITDATPDTLSRDVVLNSSIGGAKLSLGVGTKTIYCEVPPICAISRGVQTFVDGDTSPSVKGGRVFLASNSAPTTITLFDDGVPGQEIIIIATNGNTTFFAGSVLRHPAALDNVMSANDVSTYVRGHASNNVWQLQQFSVNA